MDMNRQILSIIVPIYNGASYIESLIKIVEVQRMDMMDAMSVRNGTSSSLEALELILVDDGSADASYEICQKFARKYEWIKAIHTENHGVSHARNTGLAAANGIWIEFLDVDDVLKEGMLRAFYTSAWENAGKIVKSDDVETSEIIIEKTIKEIEKSIEDIEESGKESRQKIEKPIEKIKKTGVYEPVSSKKENSEMASPDIIVCGCNRIHGTQEVVPCGPKENNCLDIYGIHDLFDQLVMEDRYWLLDYCWNKWYKKSLIDKYALRFDETLSLGEDFVFNANYMMHVRQMRLLKTCFYEYRVGDTGLASRFQPEPWNSRRPLYEAQKELYQTLRLWESNQQEIEMQYGQILFGDIRTMNSEKCTLSRSEKMKYLENMTENELFSMVLAYLKGKKSPVFRFYYQIWKTKQKRWILAALQVEKTLKKIRS